MAGSGQRYWVVGMTLEGLVKSLNAILGLLADRLDVIQGNHGQPTIYADTILFKSNNTTYGKDGFKVKDSTGTTIHQMGDV